MCASMTQFVVEEVFVCGERGVKQVMFRDALLNTPAQKTPSAPKSILTGVYP